MYKKLVYACSFVLVVGLVLTNAALAVYLRNGKMKRKMVLWCVVCLCFGMQARADLISFYDLVGSDYIIKKIYNKKIPPDFIPHQWAKYQPELGLMLKLQ